MAVDNKADKMDHKSRNCTISKPFERSKKHEDQKMSEESLIPIFPTNFRRIRL